MRVACTGDFHGLGLPEIPDCELLLVAGDIGLTEYGEVDAFKLASWIHNLHERKIEVVAIAGNHDYNAEDLAEFGWWFLENSAVDVLGKKVWGSPMSPTFRNWAYMRPDADLADIWSTIPADTDIVVVHGPPYGLGDYAQRKVHCGSQSLLNRLAYGDLAQLKLVACGHIHEGYGQYDMHTAYGEQRDFLVVNGSWVDERYRPGNPPIIVEL